MHVFCLAADDGALNHVQSRINLLGFDNGRASYVNGRDTKQLNPFHYFNVHQSSLALLGHLHEFL